jgi:hypothetical protein
MMGVSNAREKTAGAIAQNGCEHRDKHLIAHMIPINLTTVEEKAALPAISPAKSMQDTDFANDWSNMLFRLSWKRNSGSEDQDAKPSSNDVRKNKGRKWLSRQSRTTC